MSTPFLAGTVLAWVALGIVVGAAALWFRWAFAVRIPRNRVGFVAAWFGGALLGIAALWQGVGWLGGVPAVLAIVGGGFLIFTVSISRQRVGPAAVALGSALPSFRAADDSGGEYVLDVPPGAPLLLKFFRGHW